MTTATARAPGPLATLPAELAALIDEPAIMFVATRSTELEPASTLAFGVRRAAGDAADRELTVFLPVVLSQAMLANLRDNGQMALAIIRPTDHRAIQLKGLWLGERRTTEDDRNHLARYRDAMVGEMSLIGVPRPTWRRVVWWPTLALRMEVREAFVQTPGPKAGRRCGEEADRT
jgi:hypothetical protein